MYHLNSVAQITHMHRNQISDVSLVLDDQDLAFIGLGHRIPRKLCIETNS
jgi:hypothetical protein